MGVFCVITIAFISWSRIVNWYDRYLDRRLYKSFDGRMTEENEGPCVNAVVMTSSWWRHHHDDVSMGAVVDQVFVRQSPNFGGAERSPKNDPSVGFAYPTMKKDAKNSRSDGMKKTHFETKSKKGRGRAWCHRVVISVLRSKPLRDPQYMRENKKLWKVDDVPWYTNAFLMVAEQREKCGGSGKDEIPLVWHSCSRVWVCVCVWAGFGNSKVEKERHQSQNNGTRSTSRAMGVEEVWSDIVDIEAKVRDKDWNAEEPSDVIW